VQEGFLSAIEAFDDLVTTGNASEGERQNGKGDYFNDLVARVLENCSDVALSTRAGVPGLIFPRHTLDVTYPASGDIIRVMVEAKMMGTPKHPGNEKAKPEGRPGSADMLKRSKEVAFKSIDLKAGYGYRISQVRGERQAPISGDLTSWLRGVLPKSFVVFGVRVISKSDLKAVITTAHALEEATDGVGVVAYGPKGFRSASLYPAAYELLPVPNAIDLGHVLYRICQELRIEAVTDQSPPPEQAAAAGVTTPAQQVELPGNGNNGVTDVLGDDDWNG
jgi:hypothetical protein